MTESGSATTAVCPWCSAAVPPGAVTCPACGANLVADAEPHLPGVTAIDPEAVIRGARAANPPRRSRLLSLITGEDGADEPAVAPPGSLAPPPPEVRREMLRMEIQAELANLTAEAELDRADAVLEGVSAGQPSPDDGEATVDRDASAVAPEASEASAPEAPPPA